MYALLYDMKFYNINQTMNFYKLPLDFTGIFETNIRNLSTCNEKESIDQHLELLLTTCPGEHTYDPEYGCKIWDLDFERVVSMSRWEDLFVKHIKEAIEKYESRISKAEVQVQFYDTKKVYEFSEATSIKKRVDIQIDATLLSTNTKCRFIYSLYLGPLSSVD